jgi:hypothetical protein
LVIVGKLEYKRTWEIGHDKKAKKKKSKANYDFTAYAKIVLYATKKGAWINETKIWEKER